MADTILGGDWTVTYLSENRQKRLSYTGSGTVYSTNAVYSALADHMDELNQMDDGTVMSAQTGTEYTIGIIDPGDTDPWFVDATSVEYLSGGALTTNGWERVEASNTGFVRMAVSWASGTPLDSTDIGKTITMTTDGDTGTIVDVNVSGTTAELWIRPATDAIGNSFNNAPTAGGAWTITGGNAPTTPVQDAAALTGELLWANIYNTGLATLQVETHQYIEQELNLLTAYKDTSDWWGDGQIDVLVQVKEPGAVGTGSSVIDFGFIRVLARQYSTTNTWFQVDLSAGGRNPIPLSSGFDLDNTTGYRQFTGSGGSGTFDVANWIFVGATWATATKRGKLTNVAGTTGVPILDYYVLGDPLTDFVVSDSIKEYTGVATGDGVCTAGTPSNVGPANLGTPPVITYGYVSTEDIDEDGTPEDYAINIDVNQNTLADMWEYLKYVTRRGETGDVDAGSQTIEGQFYRGLERNFVYSAQAGSFTKGDTIYFYDGSDVLQARGTLGAIEDAGATGELLIYEYITVGADADITKCCEVNPWNATNSVTIDSFSVITPIQKNAFGDFAGGTFFGAEGVVLTDYITSEANSFQLKDNQGTVRKVPSKISLTIGNTRLGDKVSVFRLNGAVIEKARYTMDATQGAANSEIIKVDPAIINDEPGKATGGVVKIVDVSGEIEDRYRFASWGTDEFALAALSGTATGGSISSLVYGTGGFTAGVKVGDIVYNSTEGAYGYVVSVDNDTTLTMTNTGSDLPVTDWNGDAFKVNGTVRAYTTSDTVYVPLIDAYETIGSEGSPGSEGASITFVSGFSVRVRARNAGVILPYEADATISATDFSNNVIRTADTIYN